MRRLAVLLLLASTSPALAEPAARPAGVQAEPPGPEPQAQPDLPQQDGGRKAVRGCPLERDCRRPHERLRDFEVEAFPRPGQDPWLDGGDQLVGAMVEREPAEAPLRPGQVRPELAWMDDLELPDLPVRWDRRVLDYLVFYKDDPRGRSIMRTWLQDQGTYAPMILEQLKARGLPADLLYVAMIESSYDPFTYSRAGASGLWQFMPDGGAIYGLRQDRWVDERNDPLRSTIAVLDYWEDLHQRFGDWHLALAAYNAGYGAVLRSIARFNTNDFWQLLDYENALPWESSIYVPKALAAAIVGHNRDAFGFGDLEARPPERWDEVTVPTSVTLATVARAAGCKVEDVKRLNPHLRRGRTPPGKPYALRVPAGGGEQFARTFPALRGDWDGYDAYVMAHGERFEDVATTFGIPRRKLMALNEIQHETEVGGGTLLVVPAISAEQRAKNLARAKDDLHASGVDQKPGEALIVAVPDKDAHAEGRRRVFYRVVSGDGLERVAKALGVSRKLLARWNGLAADARLHPRMILQAWVDEGFDEDARGVALLDETRVVLVTRGSQEHLDLQEARVGRVRVEYTATRKESFEDIGRKFGLGSRDLARINRRPNTTVLQKGETIIVYQVVDKTRSERAREQWSKTPKANRKDEPAAGSRKAERTTSEPPGDDGGEETPEDTDEAARAGEDARDAGPAGDGPAKAKAEGEAGSKAKAKGVGEAGSEAKAKAEGEAGSKAKAKGVGEAGGKAKGEGEAGGKAKAGGEPGGKAKEPTADSSKAKAAGEAKGETGGTAKPAGDAGAAGGVASGPSDGPVATPDDVE
jgi:membrane-bound lytic murein transglycosylase D